MAVRIAGVTIPNEKRVEVALTYIFGIGKTTARAVLAKTQVSADTRVKDLGDDDINKLRSIIEKEYRVEGDLRRDIIANIKRLKDINCYRGLRHLRSLPAHGQRTKTNSRTVRGNIRRTAISGKKPVAQKT